MISIKEQVKFFDWQLNEVYLGWEAYLNTSLKTLFETSRIFRGELFGIDEKRGNIIFRFLKSSTPRIDNQFSLYLYRLDSNNDKVNSWDITFKEFKASVNCHFRENSNLTPIYYLNNEDSSYNYVGCANIDVQAFEKFESDYRSGKKTLVILGEKEPPYQFLQNLKAFVSSSKNNDLSLQDYQSNNYKQLPLSNEDKINIVEAELELKDSVIIQGPPGTGKSTLTAEIVARAVKKNKSVCITALSNKALMEIASKEVIIGLPALYSHFKTALTQNELKQVPSLKHIAEVTAIPKSIIFTTYHKLSSLIANAHKTFDLLVIEEASQAFYPVLSSFSILAKKTIIIGDPKQLSPIVLNEGGLKKFSSNISKFVNGLETLMRLGEIQSFLLSESFRLSSYNAALTGIFYQNKLTGSNKECLNLKLGLHNQSYFNILTPHQIMLVDDLMDREDLRQTSLFIVQLLKDITIKNSELKIAILTPYKKDILYLQQTIFAEFTGKDCKLIIETIDKVQGLTVDITILVLILNGSLAFTFNLNRFNVATSRAKYYNLTITDKKVKLLKNTISPYVYDFINRLPIV